MLKSQWETKELLGYAYYSERGYRILIPLVKNRGYDFVAEKDGKFIRVNVKVAGLKDKTRKKDWSISLAGGSGYITQNKRNGLYVDVYLVCLPDKKEFIELPGDFFADVVSKCKRIPKEFLK